MLSWEYFLNRNFNFIYNPVVLQRDFLLRKVFLFIPFKLLFYACPLFKVFDVFSLIGLKSFTIFENNIPYVAIQVRISKIGGKQLRHTLYMCALNAKATNAAHFAS
jgi:hypothetical protein